MGKVEAALRALLVVLAVAMATAPLRAADADPGETLARQAAGLLAVRALRRGR